MTRFTLPKDRRNAKVLAALAACGCAMCRHIMETLESERHGPLDRAQSAAQDGAAWETLKGASRPAKPMPSCA